MSRELRYLLSLIKYALTGENCPPKPEGEVDWAALQKLCKVHKIEALVWYGIKALPDREWIPQEIRGKFEEAWNLETAREAVQQFSAQELLEAFEREKIAVLPLKGMRLKQFYPVPMMRMMSDLDILFRQEQKAEIEKVMLKLGYSADHTGGHHDVYSRRPVMNVEMHHHLIDQDSPYASYYTDPWAKAVPVTGRQFEYEMTWEDYYIFMIVHLAKHIEYGGSGIRSIVDLWVFWRKMKGKLDEEYIEKELRKLKLFDFSRHMEKLAGVWFDGKPETALYLEFSRFMIGSGVYGTVKNYNLRRVAKADENARVGQVKIWLEAIFLPYRPMKEQYRYLEKWPVLLPLAWIQRMLRTCFRRRGRASAVFSGNTVNLSEVRERQELFARIGL